MSDQPTKSQIKAAQAKHLADLFGDEAGPAPTAQQATAQSQDRGRKLSDAAKAKERSLADDEAAKLAELKAKQAAARKPQPRPAPQPAGLSELADRNDLADAALRNMRQHLDQTDEPTPRPPAPAPVPEPTQPTAVPQPSSPPPAPAAPTPPTDQAPPAPRRTAPSPEELDRLLRAMARRSPTPRPRPSMGGTPGAPEGPVDAAPQVESPPDIPEEAPEKNREKQAEIIDQLKAREASVQGQATPIPQHDQERAVEAPVKAEVSIRTEGNAVRADELHAALEELKIAMSAHDPVGQVGGVNEVHKKMPGHPLNES